MAVVLITLSPFRDYAIEARSYSLLVGFLSISAVFWQRIGERWFMTPLFALFLILAVSCHHLAVVAISSFGFAELTWIIWSRRIRWGVWATFLLATIPFFLGLPLLFHFQEVYGAHFWARPSWGTAITTYRNYLMAGGLWLTLVLIVFFGIVAGKSLMRMLLRPNARLFDRDFDPPEIILVGGFLFFPALLVVLTKLLGAGYTPRYGSPAIIGLVLGAVYLFFNIRLKPYLTQLLGALLIVFAVQGSYDFTRLAKAGSTSSDERWTKLAELSCDEIVIPVVIGSGLRYLEAANYAPKELRDRLVQVVDADNAIRLVGTDNVDTANHLLAQFIPLRVEYLVPFQAAHQRFILYSGGGSEWFTQYLVEKRYHLRLLLKDAGYSIYMAER
jgi:hypothetical protein